MKHLEWALGRPRRAGDYGIFRTAFVDGRYPPKGPAQRKKRFSVIECGDWVNVVALTKDAEVVLVRQFRVGRREVCLEIPGGMIDPGERPLAAAKRELLEETGYRAPTWRKLGVVAPNPAVFDNQLHTFLATSATRVADPDPDPGEVIEVSTLPLDDTWRAIQRGAIDHALVVAAFGLLAADALATPGSATTRRASPASRTRRRRRT